MAYLVGEIGLSNFEINYRKKIDKIRVSLAYEYAINMPITLAKL